MRGIVEFEHDLDFDGGCGPEHRGPEHGGRAIQRGRVFVVGARVVGGLVLVVGELRDA